MATKSQKVYVDCTATGCNNGVLPGNKRCPNCNGHGYTIEYVQVESKD